MNKEVSLCSLCLCSQEVFRRFEFVPVCVKEYYILIPWKLLIIVHASHPLKFWYTFFYSPFNSSQPAYHLRRIAASFLYPSVYEKLRTVVIMPNVNIKHYSWIYAKISKAFTVFFTNHNYSHLYLFLPMEKKIIFIVVFSWFFFILSQLSWQLLSFKNKRWMNKRKKWEV